MECHRNHCSPPQLPPSLKEHYLPTETHSHQHHGASQKLISILSVFSEKEVGQHTANDVMLTYQTQTGLRQSCKNMAITISSSLLFFTSHKKLYEFSICTNKLFIILIFGHSECVRVHLWEPQFLLNVQ